MRSAGANEKAAIYVGVVLIAFGLILNKFTIGFYTEQGSIVSGFFSLVIVLFELLLIAVGVFFMARKPRGSANVAVSLSVLGLSFVAAELVAVSRGVFSQTDFSDRNRLFYGFFEPDAELGFKPRPDLKDFELSWLSNSVTGDYDTDTYGLRNVGKDYAGARVFFVGDSFTFGAWVERQDTFYGVIESRINEPVISLGVGGYGLRQYRTMIARFLEKYHPDVVALCVFANDLAPLETDAQLADYYRVKAWDKYESMSYRRKSIVYHTFRLLRSVGLRGQVHRMQNGLTIFKRPYGASRTYVSGREYVGVEKIMGEIIDLVKGHDATLLLVLIPSKESVYKAEYVRAFKRDYLRNEEDGFARLGGIARERGIECIDLTDLYRRLADTGETLYFETDPHWNERGHAIAADAILPHISPHIRR
ncbi:MAG: SGNH/GDSL hydrolase family protein [Candidatus Krumholzibacteriia bacterium]